MQKLNKKSSFWVLITGVVIALIVVVAERASVSAFKQTETIVVAKQDTQAFIPIDPTNFELKDWPKMDVPDGAFHSLDDLKGKWTKGMIVKGTPVTTSLAGKDVGSLTSSLIAKGTTNYRFVSVPADDLTTFGDKISPGDYVDVVGDVKMGQGGTYQKLGEHVLVEELIKTNDNKQVIGLRLYTTVQQADGIEKILAAGGKIRYWVTTP
jgi:Flp pilus assembly protein CpaB